MDLTEVKKKMQGVESLATTLGLEFISTPDPDTLEATMQVTPAVSQPFGFLNGGTSLAIAENVAGVGSYALCPDRVPLGLNVSANHLLPVPVGERVRAKAASCTRATRCTCGTSTSRTKTTRPSRQPA